MRLNLLILLTAAAIHPALAQDFQKHHFNFGLGAGIPGDELSSYYDTSFSWAFGYGYRPVRYLQADIGLDTVYNAARVNEFLNNPQFGFVRIRDYEFMMPLGGRAVLPLADGKYNLYGGGGTAYLRYTERLRQPSQFFNIACPVCQARSGWGYYFLMGGDVALTAGGALRLGVTSRVYQATTDGPSVGEIPPVKTRDRWINTYVHISFSF
jgi:hypothetical protein